jgi:hypothetical protein
MRFWFWCLFFIIGGGLSAYAQQPIDDPTRTPAQMQSVQQVAQQPKPFSVLDSVVAATKAHEQYMRDSASMQYIKAPDSAMYREYVQRIIDENTFKGSFLNLHQKLKSTLKEGHHRQTRDQWVVFIIIALLLYMGLINLVINKDVKVVLYSFYSKRVISQAGKEEGFINFWSFVSLFLLFGFTFGLFLYQLAGYYNAYYSISGVRLFITLSIIILALFAVKFVVLKIIGFIFDINRMVSEYISILYLTYFNVAFVFLPVTVCFSMMDMKLVPYLLGLALVLIIAILVWLFLRSSVSIISNFRFRKFYLIIYLCALEICPILILIKALNI